MVYSVFRSSQDSAVNFPSSDKNVKISLMSHPQNEDATKYKVGRKSYSLDVVLAIDDATKKVFIKLLQAVCLVKKDFIKFKMTVTNEKKPPPHTIDIYMSDVPVSESEFLLDGRKMQWICTQEIEGMNRKDPYKAGFHFINSIILYNRSISSSQSKIKFSLKTDTSQRRTELEHATLLK